MRRGKQVIYGFIYLVFWCAVAAAIYFLFFRPGPPAAVTCGNRCVPTSTRPLAALGNVFMFTTGSGSATLLAQVENPNTIAAAKNFAYQFDLLDASGSLVQTISAESFAYAGDVNYLLAPNQSIATSAVQASLTIGSTTWASPSVVGAVPALSLQNVATGGGTDGAPLAVTGEIVDQDVSSFNHLLIVAIFNDANGTSVGASQTELDSIAPNQMENFSITYPAVPNADPSRTQLFAYALRP